MSLLRRITYSLSISAFRLLLFVEAAVISVIVVLGTGDTIKQALLDADAYDRFVPALIEENIAGNQQGGSIPLEDPSVQVILTDSFPADVLRAHTETVIDATYNWLNGSKPAIDFRIDFTSNKQAVAEKLSIFAFERFETLPLCNAMPAEINPFTIPCAPPGLNIAKAQEELTESIASTDSFLPDTTLTAENLPRTSEGKEWQDVFSFAPTLYEWLFRVPWVVAGLILLSVICSMALHTNKRTAFRHISWAIAGNGVFLIVSPLLFGFLLPSALKSLQASFVAGGTQEIIDTTFRRVSVEFDSLLINMGIQLAVIGIVLILLEKFSRPATHYGEVHKRAGLVSSIEPKQRSARYASAKQSVPLQSSEESSTRPKKRKPNAKYRKIPKKEI